MIKRIFALFLVVIMAISAAACANDAGQTPPANDTTASNTPTETSAPTDESTAPAETGPTPALPDVGDQYKGTELTIVHRGTTTTHYKEPWIYAEAINGDTVNDAVYKRNSYIEDKYGIQIVEHVDTDVDGCVDIAIQAQDDIYDIAFPQVNTINDDIFANKYYPITDLPHIDTDMPWWDSNCVEGTSYNGKFYIAISDISLMMPISSRAIIFNRDLIRKYELDDPYQLVKDNQWTLEKMSTMVQAVSDDLDGDSKWTDADCYGMLTEGTGIVTRFITGAGEPIFVTNAEGEISCPVLNERTMNIIDICRSFLQDKTYTRDYNDIAPEGELDKYQFGRKLFSGDHFAFTMNCLLIFDELTQFEMESEYGIVPCPKIMPEQENYQHSPDRNATGMIIPGTNAVEDLERLSILLEDMAYMSSKVVVPEYYETIIKLRRARVPELGEMVDLIKNSIYYDITFLESVSWSDAIGGAFNNGNYASTFTRYQKIIDVNIKKLQKKLDALK